METCEISYINGASGVLILHPPSLFPGENRFKKGVGGQLWTGSNNIWTWSRLSIVHKLILKTRFIAFKQCFGLVWYVCLVGILRIIQETSVKTRGFALHLLNRVQFPGV